MTPAWVGGDVTSRATCVLAPNPGAMTLEGTNTWVLMEPGSAHSASLSIPVRSMSSICNGCWTSWLFAGLGLP